MVERDLTSVLETIGYPRNGTFSDRSPEESKRALESARRNKVETLYLQALSETETLEVLTEEYETKQQYQKNVVETCERISELLNGVKFSFVKSIHPFPADASDVDVAVFDVDDLQSLAFDTEENGYRVLGIAPSAATIKDVRTGQLVDLQSFFGLHKVVYYNHERLSNNIITKNVGGNELPVPARPYDLSLIVNHSVTELMFLLKEYYAMIYMLETVSEGTVWEFIEDIRFNRSKSGCQAFITLIDTISEEVFSIRPNHMDLLEQEIGLVSRERSALLSKMEIPYRYTRTTLTRFTVGKFRERDFRRSFIRQVPSFVNPKTAGYILKKVYGRQSRETY